jgi:hypothetical protein
MHLSCTVCLQCADTLPRIIYNNVRQIRITMDIFPYDTLCIILNFLLIKDIIVVSITCRTLGQHVKKYLDENPLHVMLSKMSKNFYVLGSLLSRFDGGAPCMLDTNVFFASSQSKAEKLAFYCLIDSSELNNSGQWIIYKDVYHSMTDLKTWIDESYSDSKLETSKHQIMMKANTLFNVSNKELRNKYADKLGV